MKGKKSKKLLVLGLVVLIVLVICGSYVFLPKKQENAESQAVIQTMEDLVPYFGTEQMYSSGMGRDPLPVVQVNGVDIVGAIEIPSLDLRAPVTDKGVKKKYFARWVSGSPVKGRLRLMGGKGDVFSRIAKGKPGERVTFTDMDGVRYEYTITTQFHLKDWSKADYDLMLCYKVDSDTKFVLGCSQAE